MTDLHQDFYSVFVYSDLVEQRRVGVVMVPLLPIVPVSEKKAEVAHHIFENLSISPWSDISLTRWKPFRHREAHLIYRRKNGEGASLLEQTP